MVVVVVTKQHQTVGEFTFHRKDNKKVFQWNFRAREEHKKYANVVEVYSFMEYVKR